MTLLFIWLMSFAMVTSPPTEEDFPRLTALLPVIRAEAIRQELLDPQECRYIFNDPRNFWEDVNLIRKRYEELKDAPHIGDCYRFPTYGTASGCMAFNREYHHYLEVKQAVEIHRSDYYQDVMDENNKLYYIWDAVTDARKEYYYVTVRRQALKRLREQIGDADFYSGQLPPCVPIWRFNLVGQGK